MSGVNSPIPTMVSIPVTGASPPTIPQQEADARRTIAFSLVAVYLALLVISIGTPILLYVLSHPHLSMTIQDVRDMTGNISGALGSLVGILGFVVGYYFKAIEGSGPRPAKAGRASKKAST